MDLLINNAGIMACPYGQTKEGFENQMGINHIGHFLLTDLLLPAVKRAAPGARIICLSSAMHKETKVCKIVTFRSNFLIFSLIGPDNRDKPLKE